VLEKRKRGFYLSGVHQTRFSSGLGAGAGWVWNEDENPTHKEETPTTLPCQLVQFFDSVPIERKEVKISLTERGGQSP